MQAWINQLNRSDDMDNQRSYLWRVASSPLDDIHVTHAVENEQHVHGRHRQVVDESGRKTPELLRMNDAGYDESEGGHEQKNARR